MAALAIGLYLVRVPVLVRAARFLDVSEPPRAVDYVVILSGDYESRPFVGAALVRAGLAKQVLITQSFLGPEAIDSLVPSEQEILRRVLLRRGVSEEAIVLLPGEIRSTFDEARRVAEFLASHPGNDVAIVTTDFHTRRARHAFRRALGNQASRVHFVAAPKDYVSATDWWHSSSGTHHYLVEYTKLIYYVGRY